MESTSRLFYIHDPMCSWCYAFSHSWAALQKELAPDIQVVYLVGGLAPDTMEPMPEAMQKNIQQAWLRIEQLVPGVLFNWDFWTHNTPIRSTYPACRAVLAAEKQHAGSGPKMVRAIQAVYYQKAMNPSLPGVLLECAREMDLDTKLFSEAVVSTEIEQALQQEIQMARNMDVYSYPSLRLLHHETIYPITVDYLHPHCMLDQIHRIRQPQ